MPDPMPLQALITETPAARLAAGRGDRLVHAICYDSRRAQPGSLFVALPGQRTDGRRFIPDALARGVVAVVAETPPERPVDAAWVVVPSARAALADLAAAFYRHPSRALRVVGVTGTDGKTTVTRLAAEILERAGFTTGWLSTVDVKIGPAVRKNRTGHTTPEAPEVQALLAEMRAAGVQVAVVEASSHALAQDRVRGCHFEIGIFTNLAPEHLNFHGSPEAYRAAKGRLFQMPGLRYAVLNADDPASAVFAAQTSAQVRTYGLSRPADLVAEQIELLPDGARFTLRWRDGAAPPMRLETRFPGRFNIANWLAAALAARLLGTSDEALRRAAREVAPPPGRLQPVEAGQPFRVVVDFAHTPQALATALQALRPHTSGRLLVAFGHAGERDPANRPAMGAAAAHYADYFVITTDDPVDEDPAEIARAVAQGAAALGVQEGRDFAIVLDRREAFRHLFALARPGDCVLLAGRGHEEVMPTRGEDVPFDDVEVARELLAADNR